MESLICTIGAYSGFFWSVNFTVLVCKLCPLFQIISDLWSVLILDIFSCWDIKKGQFQFLVTFLAVFFWSVNCTNQVCMSSHIFDMDNVLFGSLQYLVFQVLAFLSILSLLFVAVFTDLEMIQFWSINYICQVCKLHIYFGHVQNFGQYLVPHFQLLLKYVVQLFYSKVYFYVLFGGGTKPCFLTKNCSKSSYICVFLSSKQSHN